jgi:hypothetical protein
VNRVSEALGDEAAFVAAIIAVVGWMAVGTWIGLHVVIVT